MGSFFSNASFRYGNLSKEDVIDVVKQAIEQNGIKKDFLIKINEKNNWATIYDQMEYDDHVFYLSATINELLNTPVFVTQCCDSDFMYLCIYIKNDHDLCSVGVPYEEDGKLKPDIEKWSALLPTPEAKVKFLQVIDKDYIFCEECLEPLAEIIGFNPEDINKTYDEAMEEDIVVKI
jgi:hypothetical protein